MDSDSTFDATELVSLKWMPDWSISLSLSIFVVAFVGTLLIAYVAWRLYFDRTSFRNFEINETEFGIGTGRLRFRPNFTDRQVAYSIWVELSTRKIGLPIDFEHDVVAEIYDSWYAFFSVTRELLKTIPVQKVRNSSTQKVIRLSIEVLNEGLRPHLTRWQARFRRWFEHELERKGGSEVLSPQEIQTKFRNWDELKRDMEQVNAHLIHYRKRMNELVHSS